MTARTTTRFLAAVLLLSLASNAFAQAPRDSSSFADLRWRFVGPYGNRAAAIAGEAGNPLVVYVGAAAGGIWKTENGGVNWAPVFDHEQVSAVGALAVSESDPRVVWAGTGETFVIRPFYPMGDGVYRSTDAGRHWTHMGLDSTGHVGRIVIDPHDADRVFVCALGQTFKPEPNRGVYRTTDGGKTWTHVLAVDANTGCSDLAIDPSDPNTLFAGMWPLLIHPWEINSGGPTGGVYVTHDGGNNWHKIVGHGMPAADHPQGKVGVAIAHSDPRRVYALVQDSQPTLYRSDDGGGTWTLVSHDHMMMQRDSYYGRFGVSTSDPDRLYFMTPNYVISTDAGKTFVRPNTGGFASAGGDNHDVWVDPRNSNRILVANDAGASISLDGSKTFDHIRLPIAQVYHVTTDDQIPYNIYGNLQDASSFMAPSNNLVAGGFGGGGIRASDFRSVGGCESGFATPDPSDNNVIWSGCYEGVITRINLRDGQVRDVSVWPDVADGWQPKDVKERWHWTIPLQISPFDSKRVYVGSQYVHETTDGGQTWKRISPDLTLDVKAHQGNSGGITLDNLYTFDGDVIYSIAESPKQAGLIWVGTNDGQVQLTKDGGARWTNLTKNIPNLPPWGTIWSIAPSPFDAATAYITVNREQMGDYDAYVYKTSDYGRSWRLISGGIPHSVNSSAHCVIEDPVRKGMLYLGTDNAVYVTWDDGGHWTQINNNMPAAPVYWLTVQKRFDDLVVATYGRGDFILDDLRALREYDKAPAHGAYVFAPRPAYRFREVGDGRLSEPGTRVIGQNPPYGADINFVVTRDSAVVLSESKDLAATQRGSDSAVVTISDAAGKTIRTLHVKSHAGINRLWWDLRGENGKMPHMLVPPPDAPWVKNGPDGYHILTGIMIPNVVRGPLVVPGTYTVRVTAGGSSATTTLKVLPDPHSLGTPSTFATEAEFQHQVVGEIDTVSAMIERLEQVRQRVADVETRLAKDPSQAAVLDAAHRLAAGAMAIEGKLMDIWLTDGNEDLNRHPSQLYQKLTALYDKTEADEGPTGPEKEVNRYFVQWMTQSQAALARFQSSDVAAFNEMLTAHHVTAIP